MLLGVDGGPGYTEGSGEEGQPFHSPQLLGGWRWSWLVITGWIVSISWLMTQHRYPKVFFQLYQLSSVLAWKRMGGLGERRWVAESVDFAEWALSPFSMLLLCHHQGCNTTTVTPPMDSCGLQGAPQCIHLCLQHQQGNFTQLGVHTCTHAVWNPSPRLTTARGQSKNWLPCSCILQNTMSYASPQRWQCWGEMAMTRVGVISVCAVYTDM